ncbi:hypothetical protein K2173_004146 [Erythroxylum novogranatense]|uniref:Uncharacterized protein n=1 Tax=Erythroxylum novogranatense TaxID=1862640 RepID=A0AAV8SYD0_9ROSI|nr:hypothetical protein K2173_004146 [Erythroxylum novogranatense]
MGDEMVTRKDDPNKPRNPFPLFPRFHITFPFFNPPREAESVVKQESKPEAVLEKEDEYRKPNTVSFPNPRPILPLPLDVESEESSGRTHNPVVIWQVYALGGFFILKWAWARWQERKDRARKESDDGNKSPDGYQSPAEDGESL